jgi:hypothetical protein
VFQEDGPENPLADQGSTSGEAPKFPPAAVAPPIGTVSWNSIAQHTADPATPDALQVVMLPDFEEQMAIKDCNAAAYSTYSLRFKDGWQLTTVNGSWDATAVPVNILKVISSAISAAADVRAQELAQRPTPGTQEFTTNTVTRSSAIVRGVRMRRYIIQPGIYKLLKQSERQFDAQLSPSADGLFTNLGIPVSEEKSVHVLADEVTP